MKETTIRTTGRGHEASGVRNPDVDEKESSSIVYESAVEGGFYRRDRGGLGGKYDNVRRYWEDQITRYALHDVISSFVQEKQDRMERIRVLDLGSGSGEGYELVTSLKERSESLADEEVEVLPSEMLACYLGLDISEAMVREGRRIYQREPTVRFDVHDLSHGLGRVAEKERAFDIYYSSYGSLSHLREGDLELLAREITDHSSDSFVFVADLLGRYSFEWQKYWREPGEDASNMRQYSMSYLYPEHLRDRMDIERFPLRYWDPSELDRRLERAFAAGGGEVVDRLIKDRSVLVGRHMNTGEFNPRAQPIRDAVNRLHEFNHRTDLDRLIFDYTPMDGFDRQNEFFEAFRDAWNGVVHAAKEALERWDDPAYLGRPAPETEPAVVRESMETVRDVVKNVRWFRMGDPRANVVEPQLGYVLRNLEMDLEQGIGAGHGLLAIYRIRKR